MQANVYNALYLLFDARRNSILTKEFGLNLYLYTEYFLAWFECLQICTRMSINVRDRKWIFEFLPVKSVCMELIWLRNWHKL